jgi:hypothetical protein
MYSCFGALECVLHELCLCETLWQGMCASGVSPAVAVFWLEQRGLCVLLRGDACVMMLDCFPQLRCLQVF